MDHGHHHSSAEISRNESSADGHAGHHAGDFLRKFWLTLVLTIPIILYSDLPQEFFGWSAPAFPGSEYLQLILGSAVFFYGGLVFLKGAGDELKGLLPAFAKASAGKPGMMTLIALAISAAYMWSVGSLLFGDGTTLFWELSTLIAVMLIGHYVEMRAVGVARGALRELAKLLPDTAEVVRDGKPIVVPLLELTQGDTVLIRPGGKVPADGAVVDGESEIDESLVTGESRPVLKEKNHEVIAGSINGDGSLTVRIEKIGEKTFLASIMRLVAEAEKSKSHLQLLSDRAALYLTTLAVGAGGTTLAIWLGAGGGFGFAVERLVAVLVIACPHALGLAIPLVASISTTMASRNGFFVKRRLALESARNITTVLFDKTGTLTEGKFSVVSATSDEVLALAAAVEAHSEHPIGKAILREAEMRHLDIARAQMFKRLPGVGAQAEIGGRTVFVGHRGGPDIIVESNGAAQGTIALADAERPEAKEAIGLLRRMGLEVMMLTGDSEAVAARVAKELGIETFFARVRPEEKASKVALLQSQGKCVAMVGDGVNDAPALAQADLGIAIGAGTNVAIESAGIILVKNDPRDIPKIIRLSRLTYTKMLQNLFWATGYNVVALPVAAGALAAYGILLQPAIAAIFMSLSTVIVAFNAALLRRKAI